MFGELGRIRSTEPQESILDHVTSDGLPDLSQVLDYLNAGHVLIHVMDMTIRSTAPGRA
ncbi:hypothetical protein [Couchioplanes azureus]|nr:hypothetical protein [Couchioplanes caeruleus]GGQ44644.1 hypothetical protein GCM10010166_11490 [Couchioplanes caeruleus subsp. azureus]